MKIAPPWTYQPKQKPNKNKAIFWSEDRTIKQIKVSSIPNTRQPAARSFSTAHGRLVFVMKIIQEQVFQGNAKPKKHLQNFNKNKDTIK